MSTIDRFEASHRRLVGHFNGGATVEVRTPNTLSHPNTGVKITTLAINGTVAAGQSVVALDAAAVDGILRKGSQYTIAGHSTTYETTADVTAASNALASVGTTTALEAEATDDDVVTITRDYGSVSYPARRGQFRQSDVGNENIQLDDWFLRVATTVAISEDAEVVWDSETVEVVNVAPFKPGTDQASVRIHCRG